MTVTGLSIIYTTLFQSKLGKEIDSDKDTPERLKLAVEYVRGGNELSRELVGALYQMISGTYFDLRTTEKNTLERKLALKKAKEFELMPQDEADLEYRVALVNRLVSYAHDTLVLEGFSPEDATLLVQDADYVALR